MSSLINAFAALLWFMTQVVAAGGLVATQFVVPFAVLAALILLRRPRVTVSSRWTLIGVFAGLPALWIFVGLWGGFFWRNANSPWENPEWIQYVPAAMPWLAVVIASVLLWRLRKQRLLFAGYALVNIYLTAGMSFLAGMAVTGSWL